jgi:hypothetical protein
LTTKGTTTDTPPSCCIEIAAEVARARDDKSERVRPALERAAAVDDIDG